MRTPSKREIIVILEDAYKQNGVYQPWTEPTLAAQDQHSHGGVRNPFQYEPLEADLRGVTPG